MTTFVGCSRSPATIPAGEARFWWEDDLPNLLEIPEFARHVIRVLRYDLVEDPSSPGKFLGNPGNHDGLAIIDFAGAEGMAQAIGVLARETALRCDVSDGIGVAPLSFVTAAHVVHDEGAPHDFDLGVTTFGCPRKGTKEHWLSVHAPLVQNCPEFMQHLREYVQYHIVEAPLSRRYAAPAQYDGIGRLEFDSFEEITAAFKEPAYLRTIRTDEPNILDVSAPIFIGRRRRLAT